MDFSFLVISPSRISDFSSSLVIAGAFYGFTVKMLIAHNTHTCTQEFLDQGVSTSRPFDADCIACPRLFFERLWDENPLNWACLEYVLLALKSIANECWYDAKMVFEKLPDGGVQFSKVNKTLQRTFAVEWRRLAFDGL